MHLKRKRGRGIMENTNDIIKKKYRLMTYVQNTVQKLYVQNPNKIQLLVANMEMGIYG